MGARPGAPSGTGRAPSTNLRRMCCFPSQCNRLNTPEGVHRPPGAYQVSDASGQLTDEPTRESFIKQLMAALDV